MKNYEFYKGDAKALRKACIDFNRLRHKDNPKCEAWDTIEFACAEHEDPPAPPKRRSYTYDEAQGLLGKVIEFRGKMRDRKYADLITSVSTNPDGSDVRINGSSYESLTEANATIDGEPFGVLFACAEHVEPPAPPKRRPYTLDEAKGLIGRRLEYMVGEDYYMEIIDSIRCTDNIVYINHASCKGYMEDVKNATVDGEPFGVLEGGGRPQDGSSV